MDASLPDSNTAWQKQVASHGLGGKTIHQASFRDSASKINKKQFLLLRVLHRPLQDAGELFSKDYLKDFIAESYIKRAFLFIASESNTSFAQYHASIESQPTSSRPFSASDTAFPELGTFTLVRYFQLASMDLLTTDYEDTPKLEFAPPAPREAAVKAKAAVRDMLTTPTKSTGVMTHLLGRDTPDISKLKISDLSMTPQSPMNSVTGRQVKAIEDEQIVNTALISFLIAVTLHSPQIKADWSLSRMAFSVSDEAQGSKKIFEARVDGVLRMRKGREVKAIAEVKPYLRHQKKYNDVRMQEAAQMAAWICTNPPANLDELRANKKKKATRLLISQDRHEIYVNFATFGAAYVDYIRGSPSFDETEAFLTIQETGPYNVDNHKHMRNLATLMYAFTLQECRD
ncbi:hypothetical protein SAPIO_CDS0745 [Scedosporium apiospermum]|uniref:Uncharacterized protein n=1 Tax=Pseudallescheria apiosperma TaxID=563466 RepID=A0A084GGG0_PSEDA|nr:uncharacterized protein SAPIO_CDS0745 [Scedosporium apiospermum]KEZ46422.1 hypothetical protein SAPIO_CDS0745 [Scedosporium apiospermum]